MLEFFGKRKLRKQQLEELESLLRQIVSDGVVTQDELDSLEAFRVGSVLSDEDFEQVRDRVFLWVVGAYCSNRRVTAAEQRAIDGIATQLGIGQAALSQVANDLGYYSLLEIIQSTPFENLPHNFGRSGILLDSGEIDYFCHAAQLLEERVVRSNYVGGSRGVSIRLMRGMTYRVGESRGHIQSERGIVPVSSGNFVITNKRLIFSGDRKSVNALIGKIMDIDLFSNGLRFSVTNRQKPVSVQFYTEHSAELAGLYLSRVLNQ